MDFIKPNRLKRGDTIAVLSPSWGGPSRYPHVFDMGLKNIQETFGFKIKEFETARMDADLTYKNPKLRAQDLNRAFADPEVSGIFASIGGDDSVRILPYLDLETILTNPKVFMGFSDTAVLLSFLCSKGLVSYNGPAVMAGFAQLKHLPHEMTTHIFDILLSPTASYAYQAYPSWANQYVDWASPGYDGVRVLEANTEGWNWLQGSGLHQGTLFGGCIEVFEFLKGTQFWPQDGFFEGKILFFETSEEKPTVSNVKYFLRNYGTMGVLDQISGLLFGRARSYTDTEKHELRKMIVDVVAGEFGRDDLPIIANMDFGHTDPQFIMPLGIRAEIDCACRSFRLVESAVN